MVLTVLYAVKAEQVIGNNKDYISLSFSFNLSYLSISIIIILVVLILTGCNSVLCCQSRVSYTEIGNKKDYISCCDFTLYGDHRTTDYTTRYLAYIKKTVWGI